MSTHHPVNQALETNPAHASSSINTGPHCWLLASPKKEFVVNTVILHIWFRSLDNEHNSKPNPMGVESRPLPTEPSPSQEQPEQH